MIKNGKGEKFGQPDTYTTQENWDGENVNVEHTNIRVFGHGKAKGSKNAKAFHKISAFNIKKK